MKKGNKHTDTTKQLISETKRGMKRKIKQIYYSAIQHFTCPYCKKIIIYSDKKGVNAITKYSKQKKVK